MPDETEVAQATLAAEAAVAIAETEAQAETAQAVVEAEAQIATAQLIHDTAASEAAALVGLAELHAQVTSLAGEVAALQARVAEHDAAQERALDALVEEVSDLADEQEQETPEPTPIAATPAAPEPPAHPVISPRPVLSRLTPREQRRLRRRRREG